MLQKVPDLSIEQEFLEKKTFFLGKKKKSVGVFNVYLTLYVK